MTHPDNSPAARLHWDERGQPVSAVFNDVYFSKTDGLAESRYVFIEQNRLAERFARLQAGQVFTIAETGFGSGLNFLCAWQTWLRWAPPAARLHYLSVEKYPLTADDLNKSLALWPELEPLAQQLTELYPPVDTRGFHRLILDSGVSLTLIFDDAEAGLDALLPIGRPGPVVAAAACNWSGLHTAPIAADAWFLDGFAPAKNPEMWTPALFQLMAKLSHTDSSFATFTAAGSVRRGLQTAGFQVCKLKGFGQKREMMAGMWTGPAAPAANTEGKPQTSWHLLQKSQPQAKSIAIIGAGLAGCHTAFALAKRGFKVTVFEQHQIGAGASGNAQGVLYTKLSHRASPLADFNLLAFLFAQRLYHQSGLYGRCGANTGVLQLAESEHEESLLQAVAARFHHSPELVTYHGATEATDLAGVQLNHGALHIAGAGWFRPVELCAALAAHPGIEIVSHQQVADIKWQEDLWQLIDSSGDTFAAYPALVVACAESARRFTPCAHLPTKAIRGQVTHAPATPRSQQLRKVLCGTGYIPPAFNGSHCLGASYDLKSEQLRLTTADQQLNLANAAAMSADLADLAEACHGELTGRSSFRCTTPDYLPLVGPAPRAQATLARFHSYQRNFKSIVDLPGCYWPALFLNLGHGSRGLAYTPLCAEILASMLGGEPLPLARDLLLHLHPSRFLIRDLKRRHA